ncbi:MAG TPA: bi-domain-containing oxidoreductase, partial [Anaerolineaceae bacterium]|nr:bi-domain-containing oxidoreductase [Anaerolineaceae bacterium]
MKQILQYLNNGKTVVEEVPVPAVRRGMVLVQTACSLVSAGTERMVVDFASKNLVGKATSRPDLVKQVVQKAMREGLFPTVEAAFNKLDQPMPLGYSSSGIVVKAGEDALDFKAGDRVACAGGGYAVHAEYALVPVNLAARLPQNVDFESAAFTTLGAIALHGFHLASPQLGESVCVIGLGLLGLLSAQIARAAGCLVFGIDLSEERVSLAQALGFSAAQRQQCANLAAGVTNGLGFDHVLICADTPSQDPVELAGDIARDRGTVVAVGAVGMQIPRKRYYEKELVFKISRSYGPGRYDPVYEEGGIDYPPGYVRWTEGRNLQAFIDLMHTGKVDVRPLISHRIPIEDAVSAYDLISGKRSEPFMGILLTYPVKEDFSNQQKVLVTPSAANVPAAIKLGVLGAGNYAQAVFLPVIKKTPGAQLVGIATASGMSAQQAARKFGFEFATTSEEEILDNADINTVVLLTRHQHHARQVLSALRHHKAVYCEKPLALNAEELSEIEAELARADAPLLSVGYNRRFAPLTLTLKNFIAQRTEPLYAHYRVNAGFLPLNHWLHDPEQGGGRIIGEACHFIDLLTFLIGAVPVSVSAAALADQAKYRQDNVQLTFRYADGSIGTVAYLANGNKNFP